MLDIIKKGMLAGIGAAVITKESAEKVLSELVEKGRISASEAKETAEKLAEQGRRECENASEALQETFDKMLRKARVATQGELADLTARIERLEALTGNSLHCPDDSADHS